MACRSASACAVSRGTRRRPSSSPPVESNPVIRSERSARPAPSSRIVDPGRRRKASARERPASATFSFGPARSSGQSPSTVQKGKRLRHPATIFWPPSRAILRSNQVPRTRTGRPASRAGASRKGAKARMLFFQKFCLTFRMSAEERYDRPRRAVRSSPAISTRLPPPAGSTTRFAPKLLSSRETLSPTSRATFASAAATAVPNATAARAMALRRFWRRKDSRRMRPIISLSRQPRGRPAPSPGGPPWKP